jgi:hypothetical protein
MAMLKAMIAGGDSSPGDGLAPAWAYVFTDDTGHALHFIVVTAGKEVTYQTDQPHNPNSSPIKPLDAWPLDSDAIATAANNGDSSVAAARGDSKSTFTWFLDSGIWGVQAFTPGATPTTATVRLDAATGKVVANNAIPTLKAEAGTFTGASGSFTMPVSQTFDLAGQGHQNLEIFAAATDNPSVQSITLSLHAPDANGATGCGQGGGGGGGGGSGMRVGGPAGIPFFGSGATASRSFDLPVPGTYTLCATSLAPGATYTFWYCTDGTDPVGDNEACKVLAAPAA